MGNVIKLLPEGPTPEECYEFGFDAAVKGPNEANCHFSIFLEKEGTAEWLRGKKAGDAWKAKKEKKG